MWVMAHSWGKFLLQILKEYSAFFIKEYEKSAVEQIPVVYQRIMFNCFHLADKICLKDQILADMGY